MTDSITKAFQTLSFQATQQTSLDLNTAVEGDSTQVVTATNSGPFHFLCLPDDIRRMVYDILPEPTFHDLSFPTCYMAYSDYTPVSNLRQTNQYLKYEAGACLDIRRAIALSCRDLVIAVKPNHDNDYHPASLLLRLLDILEKAQNRNITDYATAVAALEEHEPANRHATLQGWICNLHKKNGNSVEPADLAAGLKAALSTMLLQLRQNAKVQIRWYEDRTDRATRGITWSGMQFIKDYTVKKCKELDCQVVVVLKDEATRDSFEAIHNEDTRGYFEAINKTLALYPSTKQPISYEAASAEEVARMFK
ncbi:hypothetical protein PTMSG1_01507 [Pyrenophora teres f. maculata]|nr:hypothetical protein PTMSG1_01507 [Pyrenophora teres f. maculata]